MTKNLIELQPAYLLHSRAFRDTSLIVDFLTRDYGRVSAVANGVRRPKAKYKGLLQPFVPLQINLSGKNELKTFRSAELVSEIVTLKGSKLFGGLYLNEIMVRLIQGNESEDFIFLEYQSALTRLASEQELEPTLRTFEFALLSALGYGIEFTHEVDTGAEVQSDQWYFFQNEKGFIKLEEKINIDSRVHLSGKELLKIAQGNFSDQSTRWTAKRIAREVLALHLGDKPLKSRQLFRKRL